MVGEGVGKDAADEVVKTASEIVGELNVRLLEAIQLGKDLNATLVRFAAVLERVEKKLGDTGFNIKL